MFPAIERSSSGGVRAQQQHARYAERPAERADDQSGRRCDSKTCGPVIDALFRRTCKDHREKSERKTGDEGADACTLAEDFGKYCW